MQSSDNAFDRVKSLLGKLDRSIDDARRRRLTDGESDASVEGNHREDILPKSDHTPSPAPEAPAPVEDDRPQTPPRSNSRYGRARPLRELPGPGQASWQRA